MPTVNFTTDELVAVTAAIQRLIEDDQFPLAPRLVPLRAALAKLQAELAPQENLRTQARRSRADSAR